MFTAHRQIYNNAAIASNPSARLKHRFDRADVDNNDTLEAEELVAVIEELQLCMSVEEVQTEISGIGSSEPIHFKQFQAWWQKHEETKWASTMRDFILFLLYPGLSKTAFDGLTLGGQTEPRGARRSREP